MRRSTCTACEGADLDVFLDLGLSPIADAYTATADEPVERYPLQVAVCAKCRLVQLLEVVDHRKLFGVKYSFYSSASAPLSAYHKAYADDVLHRYGKLARRGVAEIGCNDGDLLRHFQHLPHVGIDPSSGPSAVAEQRGCTVIRDPFDREMAQWIRDDRGPMGVVIANHVLAHVEDVADMLAGVSALLADDGVAMVEVQYLPDLLVNNAFDLVYHEHRNFFSLSSLEQAAGRHDLYVADAELTDRQGGSLRVTLRRFHGGNKRIRVEPVVDALRASESWLNSFGAYEGMQGRAERIRERLVDLVSQHETVAVYGAPAKATTLLNFCGLTARHLRWCEDSTPAKRGRYIPGVGIPILPPMPPTGDPVIDAPLPDAYLLAAWNYAAPIMAANPGNRWIVPFPAPVLL